MIKRYFCLVIILLFIPSSGWMQNSTHSVKLTWDPNPEPDLAGYKIYYGNGSRNYHNVINVGNVVIVQVDGLTENIKWYFAATAYDTAANESGYSNEVWILFEDSTIIDMSPPLPPVNLKVKEK